MQGQYNAIATGSNSPLYGKSPLNNRMQMNSSKKLVLHQDQQQLQLKK